MKLGIRLGAGAAALAFAALAVTLAIGPAAIKGVAPRLAGCDGVDKARAGWTACLGPEKPDLDDAQLFYAGYWLARGGSYEEALGYLRLARNPDARILTYTGFATRKLGDTAGALPYYTRALALDPDYAVARAYLGEAFLDLGEPAKAKEQLAEVEKRRGAACAEYAELARAIERYEASGAPKG